MTTDNAVVEVVEALTGSEGQQIREWWDENTRLSGAPLPDLLDILHQSDTFVGVVDEWWLQHGDTFAEQYGSDQVAFAAYATVILEDLANDAWMRTYFAPTFTDKVKEILERLP